MNILSLTTVIQERPTPEPASPRSAAPQPAAPIFSKSRTFWIHNREATLNWLAFGLLLAAWNTAGDDGNPRARPDALRGYASVSVRAAHRSIAQLP